ncbi:hypothetical protein OC835_002508 [Tilletia horrida]|nr:hypothetical protein OC835_002508 [Tilletia horrida]
MPLHRIFHPPTIFQDPAEKQALAAAITDIYSGPKSRVHLPRFYVVVVFHQLEPGSFFVGGEQADNFVRIAVEHIAVQLPPNEALKEGKFDFFLDAYEKMLKPFIADKGFNHEVSISSTPRETWRENGIYPPEVHSPAQKRWHAENKATPYTAEENVVAPEDRLR